MWLSTRDLPLHVETRKLAPCFTGPLKVLKRINPVSYQLLLPRSMRIHPTFHISRLKPVVYSPLSPSRKPPPVPPIIGGQAAYTVRQLHCLWDNPVSCGLGGLWPRGVVLGASSRYSRPRSHQGVPLPWTTQLGERQEPILEEGLL